MTLKQLPYLPGMREVIARDFLAANPWPQNFEQANQFLHRHCTVTLSSRVTCDHLKIRVLCTDNEEEGVLEATYRVNLPIDRTSTEYESVILKYAQKAWDIFGTAATPPWCRDRNLEIGV